MKSKALTKITTLSLILILCITTIFGLMFTRSFNADAATNSLKFKQIEVGEDFAIALSYDNQIYGWSLRTDLGEGREFGFNKGDDTHITGGRLPSSTKTLGQYYPTTPTKLPYTLTDINGVPPTETSTDFIKKIATTRTTAAFITNEGFIYTWGLDEADETNNGATNVAKKDLLFREIMYDKPTTKPYFSNDTYYEPWMIDYTSFHYVTSDPNGDSTQKFPSPDDAMKATEISGGTNNYVVTFNGGVSGFASWGNGRFNQLSFMIDNKPIFTKSTPSPFFKEDSTNGDSPILKDGQMFAGSNYVVRYDTTNKLSIQGKNYYLNDTFNVNSPATYTTVPLTTPATSDTAKNSYIKLGSVTQKLEHSTVTKFSQFSTAEIASVSATFSNGASQITMPLASVALSNGYGYYIDSAKNVYFFGNNKNRQAGDTTLDASGLTKIATGATQVVAGKIPSFKEYSSLVGGSNAESATFAYQTDKTLTDLGTLNTDTATITNKEYTDSFKNTSDSIDKSSGFISAILKSDGSISAWNENGAVATVEFEKSSQPTTNNKVVALSSGYGNNLFALTSQGKIIKIAYDTAKSKFIGKMQQKFSDDGITEMSNWKIQSEVGITFNTGYRNKDKVDALNKFVTFGPSNSEELDVNFGATKDNFKQGSVFYKDQSGIMQEEPNTKFVSENKSGDRYRIMVPTGVTVENSSNFNDTALGDFKITFSVDDNQLTPEVLNKFLTYSLVYNSATDRLQFKIVPKSSTLGKKIKINFTIGRYDAGTSDSQIAANAGFYDFKNTTVLLEIQDSEISNSLESTIENSNSTIPLLDPNNPYNKNYSVAIRDVNTGFSSLADLISNVGNKSKTPTELVNSIKSKILIADLGFPAAKKIVEGDLKYTLGETAAAQYYNDSYKYFVSDDDSRYISTTKVWDRGDNALKKNISLKSDKIEIILPLTDLGIEVGEIDSLLKIINDNNSPETNAFSDTFKNNYNFAFKYVKDTTTNAITGLSISYDIVSITANSSTESVSYKTSKLPGTETDVSDVGKPIFGEGLSICCIMEAQFSKDTSVAGEKISSTSNSISVHSQSSLRMRNNSSDDVNIKDSLKSDSSFYGKTSVVSGGQAIKNELSSTPLVMTVGKSATINISDFFNDYGTIGFFARDNSGGINTPEAFEKFNNTFDKAYLDVKLNGSSIVLKPTSATKVELTLEIRRLIDRSPLYYNGEESEAIFIHLTLTSTKGSDFITKPGVHYSNADITNGNILNVRIDDLIYRQYDKASTQIVGDIKISGSNTSPSLSLTNKNAAMLPGAELLTFKVISGGSATVSFVIKRYNDVQMCKFTVDINAISQLPDEISIGRNKIVFTNTLKIHLKNNSTDSSVIYDKLILDNTNSEPYYFQAERKDEINKISYWEDISIEDTGFVSRVAIDPDSGSYLKIFSKDISSEKLGELPRIRIVFKFRENIETGYKQFETAAVITPSNRELYNSETQAPLVLNIVYGKDLNGADIDGKQKSVVVTLDYLTDFLNKEEKDKFNESSIIYISVDEGASKYFEVLNNSGKGITITPIYPTKEIENDRVKVTLSLNMSSQTSSEFYSISFYVNISGIAIDLNGAEYGFIFLVALLISVGVLFIIFMIRMGVYWRRRSVQRKIIKKNQMLIKMRDKMHNKSSISKGEIVKTKLKMEDPKYAKMFTELRKEKEAETGISLDNSTVAKKAESKVIADERLKDKKNKKKGGKSNQSIEALKAELAAKKIAYAQMQANGMANPLSMDSRMGNSHEMDSNLDDSTLFNTDDRYSGNLSREEVENQIKAKLKQDNTYDFEALSSDDDNDLN